MLDKNFDISKKFTIIVVVLVAMYKIFNWASILNITPDSASYISTTKHFIDNGTFVNLTNWPSMTLMPIDEPFTDCAPGLPLVLSSIMRIMVEPLASAFVLQAVFLGVLFVFIFKLFEKLNLSNYSILTGILLIAFFPMTSRVLYSFYAEIPLLVTIIACLFFSLKLYDSGLDKQYHWYIAISLFLGSSFKYIGVFSILTCLLFLYFNQKITIKQKLKLSLLFLMSGSIPVILWFIRNKMLYGYTTYSHRIGNKIDFNVFDSFLNKLGSIYSFLPYLAILGLLIFLTISILPLFLRKFSLIINIYLGLYSAFIINFIGIVFLSMISDFNELGPRLLFPSVICLIVCLIYITDKIISFNANKYLLILIVFVSTIFAFNQSRALEKSPINYPLEKDISTAITRKIELKSTTHYYSEFDNYLLQVYLYMPIRFMNDINFNSRDTNSFLKLKNTGNNPFFIFNDSSQKNIDIDPLVKSGTVEKIHLKEYKTSIYKFRN